MNPQETVFNPRVLSLNPKVFGIYPRVYNPRHVSTEAYRVMTAIDWCTQQFATRTQTKKPTLKKGLASNTHISLLTADPTALHCLPGDSS